MQTPTRAFQALHDVAVAAAGLRDPRALATLVVDKARDLLETDAAALYWLSPDTGLLTTLAHNDAFDAAPEPPFRPGDGAAGRAFRTAAPVRVDDYQNWPAALRPSLLRGIASGLAVPLLVSHRAVGALGVFDKRVRRWSDDEERLLLLLAAQVAPAMEAARLTEATNQQAHNFRALHEVAIAAGGLRDLGQLGGLVVDRARQLLNTESATLRWWDEASGTLRLLAVSGPRGEPAADRVLSGEGTLGEAFQRREPVVVDGSRAGAPQCVSLPAGVRASLAVPVMARDEPLGALGVASAQDRTFSRDEIQLLSLLAAQVGPALEAARLYADSERRRQQAEALADLVRQGALQPDLDRVMSLITEHGSRLLGADYAALALVDHAGRMEAGGSHGTRSAVWTSAMGGPDRMLGRERTVVLDDIESNPELPSHVAEGGRAAVATPLIEAGAPIGTLMVGWRTQLRPSQEQVRLVESIAVFAATLIENARAHDRERALANEAATRSAELTAVIDHIPDGVYVADRQGRVILMNHAGAEMMGRGHPEIEVGEIAVLDPKTREPIPPGKRAMDQALGGWKVTRREAIVQRPGKPELRVAASAVPIRNAEGALTGALVVFTDVTPESQLLSELATSEEKYRLLFDRNPEAMWVRETGTQRFLAVNETALRRYGWTRDEFLSLPLDALQPPEERARLASVRGPNDDYSGPWRHLRKDGSIIAVEISSHPIEFGGQQARLVIAADVSDRQRARELLIESEEQLRTIFDQAPIGLVRVDLGGHVREANLALRTMLGLVNTSLVGMPFARILRHPKGDSVDLVAEIVEGDRQHQAFEFPIDRGDGVARWGSATISMVRGADHEPLYLIGMLEDITDRRAHTEQLEYRALHDTLTDLPNRALFNDRLSRAILTAQGENHRLALLILDLNRFKEVNDTFGHPLGDALLQQVGPRLAEHLRDSDTLARLGGDEFAVVLPAADDQAAAELAAARILEALKEPFLVDGRELRIGGAIGIAMTPEHGTDAQTVARHADTAMYAAKRTGAGFATYSPDQDSLRPVAPDPRD